MGARSIDPKSNDGATGWELFDQVPLEKIVFEPNLSLYHIQMLIVSPHILEHEFEVLILTQPQLYILYLKSATSRPNVGWVLTGIAMRIAQERGLHRRGINKSKPSIEGELWKRCVLVLYD